jgi:hypothetical protein
MVRHPAQKIVETDAAGQPVVTPFSRLRVLLQSDAEVQEFQSVFPPSVPPGYTFSYRHGVDEQGSPFIDFQTVRDPSSKPLVPTTSDPETGKLTPGEVDLLKLDRPALEEIAAEVGVKFNSKTNKAELVHLIIEGRKAAEAAGK